MCRGTLNMEDVYLISVNKLPKSQISKMGNPAWFDLHGGLPVDKCIGEEIENLVSRGVVTVGCCCGHGKDYPMALVSEDSETLLKELGYEMREFSSEHSARGIYEVLLK